MTDDPHVWHYGLMAERWAEFIHEAPEVPYFLSRIEQYGQPVLDLGCGAGRLLLPLSVFCRGSNTPPLCGVREIVSAL